MKITLEELGIIRGLVGNANVKLTADIESMQNKTIKENLICKKESYEKLRSKVINEIERRKQTAD